MGPKATWVSQTFSAQMTQEKGLEWMGVRLGWFMAVWGGGLKLFSWTQGKGGSRPTKVTLHWAIYASFTSDSKVSDNEADVSHPQVA